MEELKPCPFCGGEAETHETTDGWIVACSSDQNVLDGFTHMAHAYGGTEAKAIAEWNTRAERTCTFKPFKNQTSEDVFEGVCSVCSSYMHSEMLYCPNCGSKVVDG